MLVILAEMAACCSTVEENRKGSDLLDGAVAVGQTDGSPVARNVRKKLEKNRVAYICGKANMVYIYYVNMCLETPSGRVKALCEKWRSFYEEIMLKKL
jgi:hypothetical protein